MLVNHFFKGTYVKVTCLQHLLENDLHIFKKKKRGENLLFSNKVMVR